MSKDERSVPEREASLVRPYTLTAGRTGTDVDLPLEAPVETSGAGLARRWPPNDMRDKIIQLCIKSPSVAEISACWICRWASRASWSAIWLCRVTFECTER